MNKYYFKINEDIQGPLEVVSLIRLLLKGSIDTSTQVSKEENQMKMWKPFSEFKAFHFLFPQDQNVPWTLLKKFEENFVRTQPYSQKGLQWLLQEGFISDQDFVWKEGDDSWNRISLSPYFDTPLETALEDFMDKVSMSESSNEDLSSDKDSKIFVYQRPAPKIF